MRFHSFAAVHAHDQRGAFGLGVGFRDGGCGLPDLASGRVAVGELVLARWQTAAGDTKAAAKAERAEALARQQLGQRIERTSLTVADDARACLDRGIGQKGQWVDTTREHYNRYVCLHIEQSNDPSQRPLGDVKLRDLTPDRIAAWSQANERVLAPTTAANALEVLARPLSQDRDDAAGCRRPHP